MNEAESIPAPAALAPPASLRELGSLFFRLGATAFGGPAAHIAMMQDEVVSRRRWLSEETFLDLLGATNLIPGPNSTEMAIHIGWAQRGLAGLLVAGVSFILPAGAWTGLLGWAYVRYGSVPEARWLLYGVKPVMLGVVAQAIWSLLPRAARTAALKALGGVAAALAVLGVHELVVLLGAGPAACAHDAASSPRRPGSGRRSWLLLGPLVPAAGALVPAPVTLDALLWVFLKIGSVLFGSGYVLLAFLRSELVERLGWLDEARLIDAIAVGQVTPGPLSTTATFIGYLLRGVPGALVATLGIFLPAFVFVALSGPLVPRLRASPAAGSFLDGVNVASLALMGVVTAQLGRAALVDLPAALIGAVSAVVLVRFRPNATWLVLGGAGVGWLLQRVGLATG